jgi:hypothetical protein
LTSSAYAGGRQGAEEGEGGDDHLGGRVDGGALALLAVLGRQVGALGLLNPGGAGDAEDLGLAALRAFVEPAHHRGHPAVFDGGGVGARREQLLGGG